MATFTDAVSGKSTSYSRTKGYDTKVNVWCGFIRDRAVGLFFFADDSITGAVYCDIIEQCVLPQVEELQPIIIFQYHSKHPHISHMMSGTLWMKNILGDALALNLALPWYHSVGFISAGIHKICGFQNILKDLHILYTRIGGRDSYWFYF